MTNAEFTDKVAAFTMEREVRRDRKGNMIRYTIPAGDNGGRFEYAGITDKLDTAKYHEIDELVKGKHYAQAEASARAYYTRMTEPVAAWTDNRAVTAWNRDTAHHRGLGGTARILQRALGVAVDGVVGPKTKHALSQKVFLPQNVPHLIAALRAAAEAYERETYPPVGARAGLWQGLMNRLDARRDFALEFI